MFRLQSQSDLLECFRISERDEVVLPEAANFPVFVRDYFSWVEPSGAKAYLVIKDSDKKPIGVVFRRGSSSPISMCEWCHSVGGGEGVALLVASATADRRVGIHVCSDLSCAEKIRLSVDTGRERSQIKAAMERMSKFARRNIF